MMRGAGLRTLRALVAALTLAGSACTKNAEEPGSAGPSCAPETDDAFCARNQAQCGPLKGKDNCGATRSVVECGKCLGMDICEFGRCGPCLAEKDPAFCSRLGVKCGPLTGKDNCGITRTDVDCGPCTGEAPKEAPKGQPAEAE
jgi:hypothetical protein